MSLLAHTHTPKSPAEQQDVRVAFVQQAQSQPAAGPASPWGTLCGAPLAVPSAAKLSEG